MQVTKSKSRKSKKPVEKDHKRVTTSQIVTKNTEILQILVAVLARRP